MKSSLIYNNNNIKLWILSKLVSQPHVFISSILLYPKSALDPQQITFLIDMSLFTYF